MLVTLSYASHAVAPLCDAGRQDLLEVSRTRNLANHVTGLLLYADRTFVQVLEGDEADVRATMQRIVADPRHADLLVLDWRTIGVRRFDRWDLAFVDAERHVGFPGIDATLLPGFGPTQAHERRAETLALLYRLPDLVA